MEVRDYHSKENTHKYWGSTQFKTMLECEKKAVAILNGEYEFKIDAFTQGQYLDAYFEGRMEEFQADHPEMYDSRKGTLKVAYDRDFKKVITAIENDPIMNELMRGEQQRIFTGAIEGVPFKIMVDSLHPDKAVDRKYMASFSRKWSGGEQIDWWNEYRYDLQAAIYSEILRQNGIDVPFELVAISKEEVPDKAWVRFKRETLDNALEEVKYHIQRFDGIKQGLIEPNGCGYCDVCRSKKMLREPLEV